MPRLANLWMSSPEGDCNGRGVGAMADASLVCNVLPKRIKVKRARKLWKRSLKLGSEAEGSPRTSRHSCHSVPADAG